jgi:RNA-directed DNA polymerase
MGDLYDNVRKANRLRKAWRVIFQNGISSKSFETRNEILEFAEDVEKHLSRIGRQLLQDRFNFAPQHGIAANKKNKPGKKRPIVKSPIPNRIVQRAILDTLQELPEINEIQQSKFNFGGVSDIGVPEAITKAYSLSINYPYFIRTDICAFFDNIPRDVALKKLTSFTFDEKFNRLLEQATTTELDNLVTLGRDGELFPLEGKGVAQGSCLSPLLCNVLLHDFDKQMNCRGVVCIRYIDDFILFSKNKSNTFKAFASAQSHLAKLNLAVYDPRNSPEKAEHGNSKDGFEFLGCDVLRERVSPNRKSKKRLLERVDLILRNALNATADPNQAISDRRSYSETISTLSNTIRGWGNTYAFCTDDRLMVNIDTELDQKIAKFNQVYKRLLTRKKPEDKRRLLGIFLLRDCKKDITLRNIVAGINNRNDVSACANRENF